jgi:hypothetical protein
LKAKLASVSVWVLAVDDAQMVVDCDASDSGLEAVLSQIIGGEENQ